MLLQRSACRASTSIVTRACSPRQVAGGCWQRLDGTPPRLLGHPLDANPEAFLPRRPWWAGEPVDGVFLSSPSRPATALLHRTPHTTAMRLS
jgi:hypothetical protein